MAPLLFYLFIFCVVLILMNMFLGILADAYAEVKSGQGDDDLRFYSNLRSQMLGAMQVRENPPHREAASTRPPWVGRT